MVYFPQGMLNVLNATCFAGLVRNDLFPIPSSTASKHCRLNSVTVPFGVQKEAEQLIFVITDIRAVVHAVLTIVYGPLSLSIKSTC